MTRNRYLEEDFERISQMECLYLYEKQMEEEQEYYEYINKLPAKINVIKKEENAEQIKELQ